MPDQTVTAVRATRGRVWHVQHGPTVLCGTTVTGPAERLAFTIPDGAKLCTHCQRAARELADVVEQMAHRQAV